MNIRSYTFEEYLERVRSFHGFAAPGVVIGGFMVDLAYQHLSEDGLFNAISETAKCLPDVPYSFSRVAPSGTAGLRLSIWDGMP